MNSVIFHAQFGSHVYGTNLPTSDTDYKGIFLPDAKDLILQRAAKHIQNNSKTDPNQRNTPLDIDDEQYSIQEYFRLLTEGQTVALDLLFTPDKFVTKTSDLFNEIKLNKHKFLHSGTTSFIGYTKAQAAKYGVKGFRLAAVKEVIEYLNDIKDYNVGLGTLGCKQQELESLEYKTKHKEYIKIVLIDGAKKGEKELALEVCNRKIPFHAKMDYALSVLQKIYDNYGERAKLAERNEGIDWKALMHAVRVAHEAKELLLTGNITFPRPEKELLLKIRKGELAYQKVAEIIEEGLMIVENAKSISILSDKPDYKFIEEFVTDIHSKVIKQWLK